MKVTLPTKRAADLAAGDRYVLAITDADNPDAVRIVAAVEPSPWPDAVVVHHRDREWKRHLSADRLVVIVPEPRTVNRKDPAMKVTLPATAKALVRQNVIAPENELRALARLEAAVAAEGRWVTSEFDVDELDAICMARDVTFDDLA